MLHDLEPHPYRSAALGEIHARPVYPIGPGSRVRRVAVYFGREPGRGAELQSAFKAWCESASVERSVESFRHVYYSIREMRVVWELHSEHASITWVSPIHDRDPSPKDIGLECLGSGKLIATTRIDIIDAPSIPQSALDGFRRTSLSLVLVEEGRAQIATDFRPDADGFTRIEFAASNISDVRRGVITRNLLEIETYRTLAIMGLPKSQFIAPIVDEIEFDLGVALESLAVGFSQERNRETLSDLNSLAFKVNKLLGETNSLFSASRSYAALVNYRLQVLSEQRLPDYTSMSRYLGIRMEPAIASCVAIENRLIALESRISRATDLLNTSASIDVQKQNREVLVAISRTAVGQFRLQQTVEGLSTIAITYYSLGILSYILDGALLYWGVPKVIVIAILAPIVAFGSWYFLRRIKQKHVDKSQ